MTTSVNDHAVIVPTGVGPVGGVVSEPIGERRGALIFLPGLGQPGRAGVNANWSRLARDLAALGLAVLRFDLCSEGESTPAGEGLKHQEGWRRSTDLAILRDVAPWFMRETGERELLLAGSCHGGRVALEFAAYAPAVRALFMVSPYLWNREPAKRGDPPPSDSPAWANGPTLETDADLVEGLAACLARGPVWVFLGEPELEQVQPCVEGLEGAGEPPIELEVAPSIPIHPVGHPRQQELAHSAVMRRVAATLDAG